MNGIVTNELVYFTGKKDKMIDFSGTESSFSIPQRFEFLSKYEKLARQWYDDEFLDKKSFSEEEVSSVLGEYKPVRNEFRKTISFDTMTAYVADKPCEFNGFYLYCGAQISNETIVMADKNIRPNPCAKYVFEKPLSEFTCSFDVYISSEYKCSAKKKFGQEQAGRSIEFRNKTLDKLKIKIFNTGEVFAMQENMWTPKSTLIGYINFDEYNHFEIKISENIYVSLNGNDGVIAKCTIEDAVDNVFFDGGMHPRGVWKIKNIEINDASVLFVENKNQDEVLHCQGDVSLPYVIGGYEMRDKRLYLIKKFFVNEFENAVLKIQTLDPYGKVWINGSQVLETNTFLSEEIDIKDFLKKGENEIKILVEPRAPEVYYFWHRHTDCYNGWFCGEVSIDFTGQTYIKVLTVKTKKISENTDGQFTVVLNDEFEGNLKFFAKELNSNKEYAEITSTGICGKDVCCDFSAKLHSWSPDSPVLYEIKAVLTDKDNNVIDEFVTETGFRTIRQENGNIILNSKKILLNGALIMQFLPSFNDVPLNHLCPSTRQIIMECMSLKNMNGNVLRLHMLGYGTNDVRFARICDKMGIMLIWTTRLIDSIESSAWDGDWLEMEGYAKQIKEMINHPSIIMWEGSNEYHPQTLDVIDRMYDRYTTLVKSVDDTRLICPSSHLYYGGGLYDVGCKYYSDNGKQNESGEIAQASKYWCDELVIRSSHTYSLLCGYGQSWEDMRKQGWKWQGELLNSKDHAYCITEFAITALANPNTKEALENEYIESYERPDEDEVFGRHFEKSEWKESQAYQAFAAQNAVKQMRKLGVDGMMWCCLTSGANNGSYMKPPIDFYWYKKLGFYALSDSFRNTYACKSDTDVSYSTDDSIELIVLNHTDTNLYNLKVEIINEDDAVIDTVTFKDIRVTDKDYVKSVGFFKPCWKSEGYYTIRYTLTNA